MYKQTNAICKPKRIFNDHIAPSYDRHSASSITEGPVKFQSDWKSLNPNLAAPKHNEILQ